MKIAICDDDKLCRTQILEIAEEYAAQNKNKDISFFVFEWAEDLIDAACKNGGFDIYILDIVMHGMNGIELGIQLRQMGYDGKIIYLTSSEEYAIDSFKVKAFNYILKPIKKDSLFIALGEVIESISVRKEKSLIVKTKENIIKLTFDSIMYAELSRRIIVYHLVNGKDVESISIRSSFSEAVQKLLRDRRFILCGASMVINMQHITMVEKDALLFKDTYKLYLSKKTCSEVRSAWYDYCFEEGNE